MGVCMIVSYSDKQAKQITEWNISPHQTNSTLNCIQSGKKQFQKLQNPQHRTAHALVVTIGNVFPPLISVHCVPSSFLMDWPFILLDFLYISSQFLEIIKETLFDNSQDAPWIKITFDS